MNPPNSDPDREDTHESHTREEIVQSPYDRLVDRTLRQNESVRCLIESHLPKQLAEHLNLDSITAADTSFIDPNLRRRFADRLFSVDLSNNAIEEFGLQSKKAYLLVLIDHKSAADENTVVQMLGYIVRIWERSIENKRALVPIIPWVIYNGIEPWNAATCLSKLIPVPDSWKRYVPALELTILDVGRMADSMMAGEFVLQLTLTLLKYGREPDLELYLRPVLQLISQQLTGIPANNLLDTLRTFVMSVNPIVGEEKINALVSDFWPVKPEPGSVADQLIKKGEEKGRAEGRSEGLREGKIELIRTLQSILGIPRSSDDEFAGKNLEALQMVTESLQSQVQNRQK